MKVQLNTCSVELSNIAFNQAIGELVLSGSVRDYRLANCDGRLAVDKYYADAGWDRWLNSTSHETEGGFARRIGELLTK